MQRRLQLFTPFLVLLSFLPTSIQFNNFTPLLSDISVSQGTLNPKFDPHTHHYEVHLQHAFPSFALTPTFQEASLNSSSPFGLEKWPMVSISWSDHIGGDGPSQGAVAAHSQRTLPADGHTVVASVTVQEPFNPTQKTIYTIEVNRRRTTTTDETLLVKLEYIKIYDDNMNLLPLQLDDTVPDNLGHAYVSFVDPKSGGVTIKPKCFEGSSPIVDGGAADKGRYVYRELYHHRQVVQIKCSRASGSIIGGVHYSKTYMLSLLSNYRDEDIKPPLLIVDGAGQDCSFEQKSQTYLCPDPKSADRRTRLIATFEPSIRYTIASPFNFASTGEKSVEVRLINGKPSIPFDHTSYYLSVVGWAGQKTKSWPINFSAAAVLRGNHVAFIGWFLSFTLSLLLATLFVTLALSNAFGIGAPFGATEIASSYTFLLQFLCFSANFLRHGTALVGITDPLKWVTLFWPIPFANTLSADGTPPYRTIGEIMSLQNALGCLFWSWAFVIFVCLCRASIQLKFLIFDRDASSGIRHTFPHRLKFGHWESRAIHFFIFPASTASCMILFSPGAFTEKSDDISAAGVSAALLTLVAVWTWLSINYILVRKAVRDESVVWIWNSAANNLQQEDESGYWVDVLCDQLNTHAVNRGPIARKILSWKWSSTVADIEPVLISGDGARTVRNWRDRYPTEEQSSSLLGIQRNRVAKNASTVDVVRTRAPGTFCPGQRMVAGLLHTDWVDILLTYQGLSYFHKQVLADSKAPYSLPIMCKISQLQGPYASGRFCFFFEGVRVPFIKIEESILRIFVGMCMGACLSLQLSATSWDNLSHGTFVCLASCFGAIGTVALASLIYASLTVPFSRPMENLIFLLILSALLTSSFSFMGYAIAEASSPSLFAEIFLWCTAAICVLLAVYSSIVIFSLISAMVCPPLEETRFLERLANCTLTIADHPEGWACDLPAYSKRETRSIKAICQTIMAEKDSQDRNKPKLLVSLIPTEELAHLEFGVNEVKRASLTGALRQPLATLFAPSAAYLGYKSVNVHQKDDILSIVDQFISSGPLTAFYAPTLTRDITNALETHKRAERQPILSIAVIPPTGKTILYETQQGWDSSKGGKSLTNSSHYAPTVTSSRTSAGYSSGSLRRGSSKSSRTDRSSRGYDWESSES